MTPTTPAEPAAEPIPEQKPGDDEDTSAAGEEDPGAAIEEMRDPHPLSRPSGTRPDQRP